MKGEAPALPRGDANANAVLVESRAKGVGIDALVVRVAPGAPLTGHEGVR